LAVSNQTTPFYPTFTLKYKIMAKTAEITVLGEHLWLLPEKAMYWPKGNTLFLADLHLGKAGHFRKAGIPIARTIHQDELRQLSQLIEQYAVEHVWFLGDLFHSEANHELQELFRWCEAHKALRLSLLAGNHDRYVSELLKEAGQLKVFSEAQLTGPFLLTHEPMALEDVPEQCFNLCGHVHPVVVMHGRGRERLRLPCFFISGRQAVLPAFGRFTGGHALRPKPHDMAFVTTGKEVFALHRLA
jgi:DNA ligase-associated metallophosphoesterase